MYQNDTIRMNVFKDAQGKLEYFWQSCLDYFHLSSVVQKQPENNVLFEKTTGCTLNAQLKAAKRCGSLVFC